MPSAVLDAPWFSSIEAIRRARPKLAQLQRAAAMGWTIPRSVVTGDVDCAVHFIESVGGVAAAKVVSPGPPMVIDGDQYMVLTQQVTADDLVAHAAGHRLASPLLLQEYVPKAHELRVTIVDHEVFACRIDSQADPAACIDWRAVDLEAAGHAAVTLDAGLARRCSAIVGEFGLSYSAIDLIVRPDGEVVFLELNPNGQWLWIEEHTGMPISARVASALHRRLVM